MVKGNHTFLNKRMLALLSFCIVILLLSWETNRANAAFAGTGIPEESIRIRIIANSDTLIDQAMKRVVRDRVEKALAQKVTDPANLDAARAAIRGQLPALREMVGTLLAERGFTYGYEVVLDQATFPEKMYDARLYSAGSYEALRITLGSGKGKNWWCVLFPPLCFADAVTADVASAAGTDGEKAARTESNTEKAEDTGKSVKLAASGKEVATADGKDRDETVKQGKQVTQADNEKPEVRSFFWDKLQQLGSWITGLF
jgi:stage II sporulation protein R